MITLPPNPIHRASVYSILSFFACLLAAENMAQGNIAPTISPITAQSIATGKPLSVSFTVSDAETASSNLVVSVNSDNQVLAPNRNIALSGSGSVRTIKVLPSGVQSGSALITVIVADQHGTVTP